MSKNKTARESLNEALVDLEGVRDEARLSLHLLSLDAKKGWQELETDLQELEGKVRALGEQVGESSAAKVREAAATVRAFVERHLRREGDDKIVH